MQTQCVRRSLVGDFIRLPIIAPYGTSDAERRLLRHHSLHTQAAFLETGNAAPASEDNDILDDNILFEDNDDDVVSPPMPAETSHNTSIVARAATLLRLHYQAAMA